MILQEDEWLTAITDPASRLIVSLANHPFRFSPSERWDTLRRTLDEHLVYFIGDGRCRLEVSGTQMTIAAGEMVWISPRVEFRFTAWPTLGRTLVVHRFRFSLSRGSEALSLCGDYRVVRSGSEALEWVRLLVLESERPGPYGLQRMKNLAALFSISVFEAVVASASGGGAPRQLPRSVCRQISELVQENPGKRCSPADLARLAGLSPDYFARLFQQSFGMSTRAWLLKQRMRHAAVMLAEPGRRISEVAAELGYADLFLFSRQFKNEFGESPTAWRRIHSDS
ncbi:MAG TPA: AraC family transcriptional regulator [Chthoniobacterales bacterium]